MEGPSRHGNSRCRQPRFTRFFVGPAACWTVAKSVGSIFPTPDLVGLSISALVLGLASPWISTSGRFFHFLRDLGFTRADSWCSTWLSTRREFRYGTGQHGVATLRDGREVAGGIYACSEEQASGHIVLCHYVWVGNGDSTDPVNGLLILPGEDIAILELMPTLREERNTPTECSGQSNPFSPSAPAERTIARQPGRSTGQAGQANAGSPATSAAEKGLSHT